VIGAREVLYPTFLIPLSESPIARGNLPARRTESESIAKTTSQCVRLKLLILALASICWTRMQATHGSAASMWRLVGSQCRARGTQQTARARVRAVARNNCAGRWILSRGAARPAFDAHEVSSSCRWTSGLSS
jgi:hypothetical protein